MLASQFSLCAVSTRPLHSLSCRSSVRDFGKPIFVLFDNVREAWVRADDPAAMGQPRDKGSKIDQIRRLKQDGQTDLRFLPFDWPDIICALPAGRRPAMARRLPSRAS